VQEAARGIQVSQPLGERHLILAGLLSRLVKLRNKGRDECFIRMEADHPCDQIQI